MFVQNVLILVGLHSTHNDDIWAVSLNKDKNMSTWREQLLSGNYQLSPLKTIYTRYGKCSRWSSADAIILKAVAMVLAPQVKQYVGPSCAHLKGHGGLKGAVKLLSQQLRCYNYIIKSDVASFYDSMNHEVVMNECRRFIKDKRILKLIQQYLNRVEVLDGEHTLIHQGIPKGCPLSPLMGAIMLKLLDDTSDAQCAYIRYMDDWILLTKTRTKLRKMVKKMHQVMHRLKFKLALDKTYIGPLSKGFDFLGYHFNHTGIIGLAKKTVDNFKARISTLYEQGASDKRIGEYVRRWVCWCGSSF